MGSTYTRFLEGGDGGVSLSDSWVGGETFVVRRTHAGVNYAGVTGQAAPGTSFAPPRKGKASYVGELTRQLPSMPEIGRPESYYAQIIHDAHTQHHTHLHEAAKVGQYITLAMDPALSWDQKLKYFRHALKRHCQPPPYPDDEVWMFYQQLAELVRQYCGYEALRVASAEDDLYAARLNMGQSRERIEDDAEEFFQRLLGSGDQCPEWFNEDDWPQLKLIRDQWI